MIFQNGNDCQWQRVRLHRNKLGEGLGNVIAVLAGVQTLTTSTINSAVNAIQWDGDGLTWNRDVFDAGFNAGLQGRRSVTLEIPDIRKVYTLMLNGGATSNL